MRYEFTPEDSRTKHTGKFIIASRRRRAKANNAEGMHTAADVKEIWDRQKHKCAVPCCQYPIASKGQNKYHVDHICALVRGGTNWPSNLQCLCAHHNSSKNAKDEYEWAQRVMGTLFPK